jgi:hypothetical protein
MYKLKLENEKLHYANEAVLHYRRRCAVHSCSNWQLNVGPNLSWVRI